MAPLTASALTRARRNYAFFNTFNSVSFAILAGNLLTLLAIKLGASNLMIGVLSALGYATYFFMGLGKRLVRKHSIVGVFAWGWLLRYLFLLPLVAAPLAGLAGQPTLGLVLVIAAFAGFNAARGVGMIGTNPVLALLAEGSAGGRDRGAFLSGVNVTGSVANLVTSLAIVLVLRLDDGYLVYAALMVAGLLTGFVCVASMFRFPEPHDYRPPAGTGLFKVARAALREKPYRVFMGVSIALTFLTSVVRGFLPVYAKDAWAMSDETVMLLSFAAGLGTVGMGLLSKLVIDRLGPKPLFLIFTVIGVVGLVPVFLVAPQSGPFVGVLATALVTVVFVVTSFGFTGEETVGQTFHFALVPKERTLDLAIVYFTAFAAGGTLGSAVGGLFLDGLAALGWPTDLQYKVFFGVPAGLLLLTVVWMTRLVPLGSASVRESLASLFSLRDLRAFDLLSRLEKSDDPDEEVQLIREIGDSGLVRSQGALVEHLDSPRFEVRLEALTALENLGSLSPTTLKALGTEVEKHPFTTAHLAARVLGLRGGSEAVGLLRRSLASEDYMLQSAATVALARLGDVESGPAIEALLAGATNPRVQLSAAYALELLGRREAVPVLVACLVDARRAEGVTDELVLALARLLGFADRFYGAYAAFLEDEARGVAHVVDETPEADRAATRQALEALLGDSADGRPAAARFPSEGWGELLSRAALAPNTPRGFRFLLGAHRAYAPSLPGGERSL